MVLYALIIAGTISGHPLADTMGAFTDMKACEAAKAELVKQELNPNVDSLVVRCIKLETQPVKAKK